MGDLLLISLLRFLACLEEENKNDGKIRKLNSDENIKTIRPLIQEVEEPEIIIEESYQCVANSDQEN